MTLHEAAAVYLIIGSVMMGPIEPRIALTPKEIEASQDQYYEQCVENINNGGLRGPQEWIWGCQNRLATEAASRETTAETCARAMREIGAHMPSLTTRRPWDEDVDGCVLHGQRVICIPSPSGLVR